MPSLSDRRYSDIAAAVAVALTVVLALAGWYGAHQNRMSDCERMWQLHDEDATVWHRPSCERPPREGPENLVAIEASLAVKSANPKKQPQKARRAPDPTAKEEGLKRDDKPIEQPKDQPKTTPDEPTPEELYEQFKRKPGDEDLEVGKPNDDVGEFNPDAPPGWASETRGDPYFQKLIADLRAGWEYPSILEGAGVPVGCMRLERDGKVSDTLFKEKSGNQELDDSVERALRNLEAERKANPEPVPEHLLPATTRWICFKFEV